MTTPTNPELRAMLARVRSLVAAVQSDPASADAAIAEIDRFRAALDERAAAKVERDARISAAMEMVAALARLDFTKQLPVTTIDDDLAGLVTGLNMLAEELKHSVVSQDELKKEKSFTQKLLRLSPGTIFIFDIVQRQNTFMSESIYELIGYTSAEVLAMGGRFYEEVFHPDDTVKTLEQRLLVASLADGEQVSDEIRLKHRAGHWVVTLRRSAIFSRDAAGKPTAVVGSVMDIRKEKALQTSLADSLRLVEETQRVAKIGSWSYDKSSRRVIWSKQMFTLHNGDPALGPPTVDLRMAGVHPDDRQRAVQLFERCIGEGIAYRHRFRVMLSADLSIWVETCAEPMFDESGALIGAQGTSQDVTELVVAEENARLERAKALQSAKLASLGEMSAGIAHEINNPLMIISGTLQALPKFLADPEQLKIRLSRIQQSVDRVARIVRGLKKYSRSSEKPEFKHHNLAGLISEAVILTGAKAHQYSTEILVEVGQDFPIWCNDVEIEQVLVNLINNAIDAVAPQVTKWVQILVRADGAEIVLVVRDSGHGIPAAVRAKLFQPFFTTKPVGEGTGLGLSIIKGILDEHKAKIAILSDDPHTCFEIRFIQADAKQDAA